MQNLMTNAVAVPSFAVPSFAVPPCPALSCVMRHTTPHHTHPTLPYPTLPGGERQSEGGPGGARQEPQGAAVQPQVQDRRGDRKGHPGDGSPPGEQFAM